MSITRTYNSTIERIVAEEVLVNASQMIDQLSRHDSEGGPSIEDLVDCCQAPDYSEAPDGYSIHRCEDDEDEDGQFMWASEDDFCEGFDTERKAIIAAWEDSGEEPDDIEASQHWIVTDWLADKLEEVGALVARDILGFNIWGRTECGQGLDQDSDLNAVAKLIDSK